MATVGTADRPARTAIRADHAAQNAFLPETPAKHPEKTDYYPHPYDVSSTNETRIPDAASSSNHSTDHDSKHTLS